MDRRLPHAQIMATPYRPLRVKFGSHYDGMQRPIFYYSLKILKIKTNSRKLSCGTLSVSKILPKSPHKLQEIGGRWGNKFIFVICLNFNFKMKKK
jgi:hypothetical protein